jgi:hypothetical protein
MMVELTYNEPFSGDNQTVSVESAADIASFADRILERYLAAGETIMPGLELSASDGESLSIAVTPNGWALIRSDANYDQNCTRSTGQAPAGSIDVRWEEPTSIPHSWFVRKSVAMIGITQWMNGDGLAAELQWSDDCASP